MVNTRIDKTFTTSGDPKTGCSNIEKLYEDSILSLLSKPPKDLPKRSQLQVLQETKEKLEKELDEAKTFLFATSESLNILKEDIERLKKETDQVVNHDQIMSRKRVEMEQEYALLSKTKISSQDKELLEKTKFQYTCVRSMTQVRFSYAKLDEDIIEGFVFNKVNNYITRFSIKTSKLDNDQIQERLMKLMEDASHPNFTDDPSE